MSRAETAPSEVLVGTGGSQVVAAHEESALAVSEHGKVEAEATAFISQLDLHSAYVEVAAA